jgi:hypothetical protein
MALPDDGRLDVADLVIVGNAISTLIAPPFKMSTVALGLVQVQDFPTNSNVIKWRKRTALTAAVLAEGAVYVPTDANSQSTISSVTTTAAKVAVGSPISYEAIRFGAGGAEIPKIAEQQGLALARKFDTDFKALIDSVTNVATATTLMDSDTILTGQFNILNSECPAGPFAAVISQKMLLELRKQAGTSGAAAYQSANKVAFLDSTPAQNGFQGSYLGTDIYAATGLSTTGGDTQGIIFNPLWAFCAGLGGAAETEVYKTGAGVQSQVPGFSWMVLSHFFYDVKLWNDTAASELRSDT